MGRMSAPAGDQQMIRRAFLHSRKSTLAYPQNAVAQQHQDIGRRSAKRRSQRLNRYLISREIVFGEERRHRVQIVSDILELC